MKFTLLHYVKHLVLRFLKTSLNCSLLLRLQIGLLSPTKLRMKLLGPRNSARKGGSNSAKMSPSKNEDMKSARNNLLVGDIDNEGQ